MMVLSKRHRNLFLIPNKISPHFGERSYLNLMFAQYPIFELDYKFNHILPLETRYDFKESYFLHFLNNVDVDVIQKYANLLIDNIIDETNTIQPQ